MSDRQHQRALAAGEVSAPLGEVSRATLAVLIDIRDALEADVKPPAPTRKRTTKPKG